MYHRGDRLVQQHTVATAAQVEGTKVSNKRHHSSDLSVALYSGIANALRAGDDAGDIERVMVVTSTFVSGLRYMVQPYLYAMVTVQK